MKQLITPEQVAHKYGVGVQELAEWRGRSIGPDYYLLGRQVIRYLPENVAQWFRDPANSRWHDFPAEAFANTDKGPEDSTMPWLSIDVHRPLAWWRATPDQLAPRVADPDVRDGQPRWESYDQNWKAIGQVLEDVGDVLATGSYKDTPTPVDCGHIHVQDPGLSPLELEIVRAWFSPAEAVTMDPRDSTWSDGRHRTWHSTAANPGILLPVRSNSLGYANTEDIPRLGEDWSTLFKADLKRLQELTWLDRTDPVNQRFENALSLAAGKIPPTTPGESTPRGTPRSASTQASFPAGSTSLEAEEVSKPQTRTTHMPLSLREPRIEGR